MAFSSRWWPTSKVENGEFSWDREFPGGAFTNYPRSPIDFHDNTQVAGTPLFDEDRFIIKFNNFWTIELPPGYSLLVTHPVNRHDLPFVDADRTGRCRPLPRQFHPLSRALARSRFNGVLPKGTPVAQCLPVKRDSWTARFETIGPEAAGRLHETAGAVSREPGIYRRQFRAPKR